MSDCPHHSTQTKITNLWRKAKINVLFKHFNVYTPDPIRYLLSLSTPDMQKRNEGFWFTFGDDGLLLKDTVAVAKFAMLSNYKILSPLLSETTEANVDFRFDEIAIPEQTLDVMPWVDTTSQDFTSEHPMILPPGDPNKYFGAVDYTTSTYADIFEGDERALRDQWLDIEKQRNWVKTEFYHNKPIINRGWKIAHRAQTKKQKEFMRGYRAQWTVVPH